MILTSTLKVEVKLKPKEKVKLKCGLLGSVPNSTTNYTTSFVYSGVSGIEFRIKVTESASNHESKYSNLGVYECNLRIEDLIESPISCIHMDDGQVEVLTSGGSGVLEYSIDNLSFQTSNTLTNLASGFYTIYVKDENLCLAEFQSNSIWEPDHILVTEEYSGDTLTLIATGGTGIYQYQVNGSWSDSMTFVNINSGYTFEVIDRNGCAFSDELSIEEVDQKDQVILYPNPAHLWFKVNTSQFDRIDLSDLNGKVIRTYVQEEFHSIIGIDKGLYLVTIYRDNKKVDTKRLVVSN